MTRNELFELITIEIKKLNSNKELSQQKVAQILEDILIKLKDIDSNDFDGYETYEMFNTRISLFAPLISHEINQLKTNNAEFMEEDNWFQAKASLWSLRTFLRLGL